MGTKWNGFSDKTKGVLEFCSTKDPEDIVCVVDGFDSVIIEPNEVEKRYKELGHELVFSKGSTTCDIFTKYILDKIFSSCDDGMLLSAGLYIGTVKSHGLKDAEEHMSIGCCGYPIEREEFSIRTLEEENERISKEAETTKKIIIQEDMYEEVNNLKEKCLRDDT
jgi:hypothetical protein